MDHLKTTQEPSYFFSDTSTKDKVRNTLINKIKRIFAVSVWEAPYDIETFKRKIINRDCCVIEGLDIFIASRRTPKFKTIKKHLEKEGLTFLNDVYFEDLENKLALYIK